MITCAMAVVIHDIQIYISHYQTMHYSLRTIFLSLKADFFSLYNAHSLASTTTPLIVYLPPTGSHLRSEHEAIPPYLLSDSQREHPLARINYRWNHVPPPITPLSPSPTDPSPSPVGLVLPKHFHWIITSTF
jgi:hypothetical protein